MDEQTGSFGALRQDAGKDGAHRIGKGHVCCYAAAEERRSTLSSAVKELIREDDVRRL